VPPPEREEREEVEVEEGSLTEEERDLCRGGASGRGEGSNKLRLPVATAVPIASSGRGSVCVAGEVLSVGEGDRAVMPEVGSLAGEICRAPSCSEICGLMSVG
jgi:hypothetical protein